MAAGLRAYTAVLADPRARAFSVAGFVARLPMSMTGLGIVLLVSITTGSFGRAGLITACATLTGALSAPLWGRLIDRVGQARVLVVAALINGASLGLLVLTVQLAWPLATTLAAAVGVGVGLSSAGSAVRARWTHRLQGSPLLNTAYAVEAVIDELVFIVGPVLVTFLATAVHPALGLLACIVLGVVGAVALARMRDTEPPLIARGDRQRDRTSLSPRLLVPIVVACFALGALFGGMEVVIVAFAKEAGVLAFTGFIVMAWASGSLLAGVITGTIQWRASPARRFRVGSLLLAGSVLPLPFVSEPVLVAGLLLLSGFAIAPTLIATIAVTQASVPQQRLTEALGWTTMGMAAGVSAGAAGLGQVIDLAGSRAGFWGVVGVGAVLIVAAMCVRSAPAPAVSPRTPDTAAAEPGRPPVRSRSG